MLRFVDDVSPTPLPTEVDFDPCEGDLDARHAWKNFGGLSLEDAYAKFCLIPEVYQEDFMFMGARAFHYYFPVIDEYLRSVQASDEWDDCEAGILGSCIAAQFDWKGAQISTALRSRIRELCEFVLSDPAHFACSTDDQQRIKESWVQVQQKL